MATKKAVSKKSVAKKAASKKTPHHKNEVKLPLPAGAIAGGNPEAGVELISFSVMAVIPTQQYGNIQPKIEVRGHSIKRAREIVMPIIEELYKQYAEAPLSGKEPAFYANVTEKVIHVEAPKTAPAEAPKEATAPVAEAPKEREPEAPAPAAPVAEAPKSEPYAKAAKMISLAMTIDSLDMIEEKIKNSTKIDANEKPLLYTEVLKKRKELTA